MAGSELLKGVRTLGLLESVYATDNLPSPVADTASGNVQDEFELLGQIQGIYSLGVRETGNVHPIAWEIGLLYSIAKAEGHILSVKMLVNRLIRAFPFNLVTS